MALVTIFKCSSRADDDCESFLRVTQKDFCHILTEKGQFWSVFYESFTPKPACPIGEGRYVIRNGTIDLKKLLESIPPVPDMDEFYWKFKTQLFTHPKKEELLCVTGGGKLLTYRRKS